MRVDRAAVLPSVLLLRVANDIDALVIVMDVGLAEVFELALPDKA